MTRAIALAATMTLTDDEFTGMCEAFGVGHIHTDPRFSSVDARMRNREALRDVLQTELSRAARGRRPRRASGSALGVDEQGGTATAARTRRQVPLPARHVHTAARDALEALGLGAHGRADRDGRQNLRADIEQPHGHRDGHQPVVAPARAARCSFAKAS